MRAATFLPLKFSGPDPGALQLDWNVVVAQAAALRAAMATSPAFVDRNMCAFLPRSGITARPQMAGHQSIGMARTRPAAHSDLTSVHSRSYATVASPRSRINSSRPTASAGGKTARFDRSSGGSSGQAAWFGLEYFIVRQISAAISA